MGFDRLDLLYSSTLPDGLPVEVAAEQIAPSWPPDASAPGGSSTGARQALASCPGGRSAASCRSRARSQLPYSLASRDWVEDPAMEAALQATGASLVPSATLAGGALTGKYGAGSDRTAHR